MDNRIWLKHYQSGVPANIDIEEYDNMIHFLDENLQKFSSRVAFTSFGKDLRYKELDKQSKDLGAYLLSRGLKQGDRVALMMPNILQYPIALLAVMRAGLIAVNTNPLYTPREMAHQFTDSGAKAIIIADNFAGNLEKIIDQTDINVVITTSIGEMLGSVKGSLIDFTLKHIKKMRPAFAIPNTVKFKDAVKAGKKFTIPKMEIQREDVLLYQYTGGTTGVAKGAMLTHGNLIANMLQMVSCLDPKLKDLEQANVLCPLPLYHIFAFTVNCLGMIAMGHRNILVVNPRDQSSLVKEFKKYEINFITGVNTLYNALSRNKDFAGVNFKGLKICAAGGMAVQEPVAQKWKEITGCNLTEGYGLTETSPVASFNPFEGGKTGSIGFPVPSTIMRIVDKQGQELAAGEIGEIQIKGPQVMKGYYNRPADTMDVLEDGWLSTGDIGKMDEEGYFFIVDRAKDMINVSGFNVYPNEIEEVIAAHPKVLEVAAIGVASDRSSECVKIFVVKDDKSLKEKELIEYCKENLTGYKIPKFIEFRDELPKSNVGKILRRVLKEEEAGKKK